MSFKKVTDLREIERLVNESDSTRKKLQEEVISDTTGSADSQTEIEKQLKPLAKLFNFNLEGESANSDELRDPKVLKTAEGKKITRIVDLANNILGNLSVSDAKGVNRSLAHIANDSLGRIRDLNNTLILKSIDIVKAVQNGDTTLDHSLSNIADSLTQLQQYTVAGSIDKNLVKNKMDYFFYIVPPDELDDPDVRNLIIQELSNALQKTDTGGPALNSVESDIIARFTAEIITATPTANAKYIINSVLDKLSVPNQEVLEQLRKITTGINSMNQSLAASNISTIPSSPSISSPSFPSLPRDVSDYEGDVNLQMVPAGTQTVSRSSAHEQISPPGEKPVVEPFSGPGQALETAEEQAITKERVNALLGSPNTYTTNVDFSKKQIGEKLRLVNWLNKGHAVDLDSLDKNILRVIDVKNERPINFPGLKISNDMKIFLENDRAHLVKRVTHGNKPLKLNENELDKIKELAILAHYNYKQSGGRSEKEAAIFGRSHGGKYLRDPNYVSPKYNKIVWEIVSGTSGEGLHIKQSSRNAYKVAGDGIFGNIHIDPAKLIGHHKLVVRKINGSGIEAEPVIKKLVDNDLINLLTKRHNPKHNYSADSIETFQNLVKMAKLPIAPLSGKSKLLAQKGGAGQKTNCVVKTFTDPNEILERLQVLAGSIESGNKSPMIVQELAQLLDILLKMGFITPEKHKQIYEKYVS